MKSTTKEEIIDYSKLHKINFPCLKGVSCNLCEVIPNSGFDKCLINYKKSMKKEFSEHTISLAHSLKEIVKDNDALMTYVCEGKVYYEIHVMNSFEKKNDSIYQLELNSNDDEWKATYLYPKFKAITLMRWIRKGFENGKLIQIK